MLWFEEKSISSTTYIMGACRHTILLKFKTGSSIDIESNDHATVYTLKYERKYNLRIIHKASLIMISITFCLFVWILKLFFSMFLNKNDTPIFFFCIFTAHCQHDECYWNEHPEILILDLRIMIPKMTLMKDLKK